MAEELRAELRPAADSPVIADAQLLVTELMTNALNARTTSLEVVLCIVGGMVRLAVRDDAAGAPSPRSPEVTDEHGRGLSIVAALGRSWGVEYRDGGKRVWVDLPLS